MDDHRKDARSKFDVECHLKGDIGDTYKVSLSDLSFSGALIKVDDIVPFQIGDSCELVLSDKLVDFPIEHASKVIWVNSGMIGLKFIS